MAAPSLKSPRSTPKLYVRVEEERHIDYVAPQSANFSSPSTSSSNSDSPTIPAALTPTPTSSTSTNTGASMESTNEKQQTELQPVPELFYEDGNLILRPSRGNKVFKVYKGILASQSSVFRDMLAVPQPRKGRHDPSFMDGCPVVSMQDDPEELEVFLKAIFLPHFFEPVPYRTTCPILIGVLRLSHKYDVPHLRQRSLRHLATAFPTDLTLVGSLSESDAWSFDIPSPSSRVRLTVLAAEVDALWALPIGLHKIAFQLSFDEIADKRISSGEGGTEKIGLPPEHRRACLKSISLYHSLCAELTAFLLCAPGPSSSDGNVKSEEDWTANCESPDRCTQTRYKWLSTITTLTSDPTHPKISPFYLWGDHFWFSYEKDICETCLSRDKRMHEHAKERMWARLPEMFGLPSWAKLKEMKVEDLGLASGFSF